MQKRSFKGWKRDLPSPNDLKYSKHPEYLSAVPLPPTVDLRAHVSPIEDQGALGSCVAHGMAACLEFLELQELAAKSGGIEVFDGNFERMSRLFMYYNARVIDGDPGVDGGTQLRSATIAVRQKGICRESIWPYVESQVAVLPNASAYSEATHHLMPYAYSIDNTNLTSMKQCLANGFPIVFGMSVFDSFMTDKVESTGIVPMPSQDDEFVGGHCMAIVGYNDGTHSFLVRNSWGVGWGIHGYCWIPYDYLTNMNLATDFWTLRKNSPSS